MPSYPETSKDTVLYEEENIYGDKDITIRMLDSAKLNIWGETWINGGIVSSGTVPVATQAEALAGTDNTKVMTPLQVANVTPYIDVRNYGATGDGSTNDSVAIQTACDAATSTGAIVLIPPGNYNIGTTGIVSHSSIKMLPGSRLTYSGSGVALLHDSVHSCTLEVHIRKPSYTWHTGADTSSIGLRVRNSNYVRVRAEIWNFWVGLDMYGDNAGTSYGVIDCITFNDNMKSVRFSKNGTGWANQHEVRGQVRINSGPPVGYAGTRYIDMSTSGNNNTFINMTLENGMPEYSVEIGTPYNLFLGCRWEGPASPIRMIGTQSYGNMFIGGYGLASSIGGVQPAYGVQFSLESTDTPSPIVIGAFGSALTASNSGNRLGLVLREQSTVSNPVLTVQAPFSALKDAIRAEITGGGAIKLYNAEGKAGTGNTFPVITLDPVTSKIEIGYLGLAAPGCSISAPAANNAQFNGAWRFISTCYMMPTGTTSAISFGVNANDPKIFRGTGTPEGVVAAGIGSTFHRTDGGAGTCFYVKESNSGGNTGWIAK